MFMLDDCPANILSKANNFQANTSLMWQSDEMGFDGAPPGFGSKGFSKTSERTCVSKIKWKSPPMFILNNNWRVAAGELSEEKGTQNHRETRVLEAVYPHSSAIPSSPTVSPGLGESNYDDRETPVIPINPIEEDESVDYEPSLSAPICSNSLVMNKDEVPLRLAQHNTLEVPLRLAQHNTLEESKLTISEKPGGTSTGLDADINAAASAAFTAIMKSKEKGSLIDTDLLVKILRDPKMIEKLSKDSEVSSTTKIAPGTEPKPSTSVSAPFIECQITIPQEPMYERSNKQNLAQHISQYGLSTFSRSGESHLNLPISNAKLLDENTNQYKYFKPSANAFAVSTPITSFDFSDKSTLMQVTSSSSISVSSSSSKTAFPSTLCTSPVDTFDPRRPTNGPEFPQMVPSTSSSHFTRFNDISSNFLAQTDKHFLHNPIILDRETFQPSVPSSTIPLSASPDNSRLKMVSPTSRENQCLPQETSSQRSFSRYSSSLSDEPLVYPISSVKTPIAKDTSYLKTLIKLHGVEREEAGPGEYLQQYRPKESEFVRISGEGETKAKVPKQCRYYNSSQGCRNGSSCPFQHDPLLKMRAGSLPDSHSSKRIKLSREIS